MGLGGGVQKVMTPDPRPPWQIVAEIKERRRLRNSGIPEAWKDLSLETIKPRKGQAPVIAQLKLCLDTSKGVYITGVVGCGKSYLMAAAIIDAIKIHETSALFVRWLSLLRDESLRIDGNSDHKELIGRAMEVPLLGIDDFGSGRHTVHREEIIEMILDARETVRQTFITSNLSGGQLNKTWGSRIASRIKGICRTPLVLVGEDQRGREGDRDG